MSCRQICFNHMQGWQATVRKVHKYDNWIKCIHSNFSWIQNYGNFNSQCLCLYMRSLHARISVIWQLKFIDCSFDHKCCYKRNEFLSTYCNVSGFSGTSISLDSQVPPPSSQIWPTSLAYVPKMSRFYTIFWGS